MVHYKDTTKKRIFASMEKERSIDRLARYLIAAGLIAMAIFLCWYFRSVLIYIIAENQHPTQTLTDLLTIRSLNGSLSNFTIGLCGDLKFGRTVHSLIRALLRYENIKFIFISPEELRIPDYIITELKEKNAEFEEVTKLEDVIGNLDILYMTRVQRERFFNEEDYIRLKDFYILNKAKLALAKETMMVLHPLPRVNEISVEVDNDKRAAYFKQAQYGVYVRMALIMTLLGLADGILESDGQ